MNRYIYKVRLVTLNFYIATTRTKIMHKHEFKQQQFQQQKKLIANKIIFEKYECFMSILTTFHF